MKNIVTAISLVLFTSVCFAKNSPGKFKLHADPSATFDSIWVDYDVTENDVKGMRIHLAFQTYGMKGMVGYMAIYFSYNDDIAGFLKDKNNKFVSTEGDVAVYRKIEPGFDPAVYKDYSVFMPYSELDLEPGIYDLTMDVKIIREKGGMISKLTLYDFEYSKPGSPADVESDTKVDATFDEMKVDYNVTENGKKGMMLHVSFGVKNMKDIDGYLAVYFKRKNGEKIDGVGTPYISKSGELAVYKSIKPAYQDAVYKDLKIFMPYDQFNIGSGKFDLKMDVDIILKNGDMVKHLKDYEFWFSQ